MPRHPRVHAEGLLYHVIARGSNGQKVFFSESDHQAFIEGLRIVRQRYPFSLYAYALMSNHLHLLVEVHRFPIARILQSLLTGYVRRFFSDASNIAGLGELSIAFLFDDNPRCWLAAASIRY
jgi:putative transposase